jgi:hypothetical protein
MQKVLYAEYIHIYTFFFFFTKLGFQKVWGSYLKGVLSTGKYGTVNVLKRIFKRFNGATHIIKYWVQVTDDVSL